MSNSEGATGKGGAAEDPPAYRLRRSARAKRMNLRVSDDGEVVLTLPPKCPEAEGRRFLRENLKWLRRKLAEPRPNRSLAEHFRQGGQVAVQGELLDARILPEGADGRMSWSLATPGELRLILDPASPPDPQLALLLRDLAKDWLRERTSTLAEAAKAEPERIRIGNQRSRWGSCSSKNTLSLNWRILLLPPRLGDYVIRHELAHLRHMNHSPAFWAHLEALHPGARQDDRLLDEAGRPLMLLGREG